MWLIKYYLKLQANRKSMSDRSSNKLWKSIFMKMKLEEKMNTDFTEIVRAAQNGDQKAFEALYNLTKDSSYFVAFSITKNENDALDIMQDSYLKAFNNISNLTHPDSFEG